MAQIVDLNLYRNGETALPLQRLLQEIDIIMTTAKESIITNYDPGHNLDRFLFKSGISASFVANEVSKLIYSNISTDQAVANFNVTVTAEFLNGKVSKDILYVNVIVDGQGAHEQMQYMIS